MAMYGCMLRKDCPPPVFPVFNPDMFTEGPLVSKKTVRVPASAEIAPLASVHIINAPYVVIIANIYLDQTTIYWKCQPILNLIDLSENPLV